MNRQILVAEDDPVLQQLYGDYLRRNIPDGPRLAVYSTDSPEEARRWLQNGDGLLLLDGSVFKQMGIRLGELPSDVVMVSGDDTLVQDARRVGLRAFCKGSASLEAMLQAVREGSLASSSQTRISP